MSTLFSLLQKFRLYVTRLEAFDPSIREDLATYTKCECSKLLRSTHEGFVKFLGPYYMLLITQRRAIGSIGGHIVYAISKTRIIALSDSTTQISLTTFDYLETQK